jgi:hypothetical protein
MKLRTTVFALIAVLVLWYFEPTSYAPGPDLRSFERNNTDLGMPVLVRTSVQSEPAVLGGDRGKEDSRPWLLKEETKFVANYAEIMAVGLGVLALAWYLIGLVQRKLARSFVMTYRADVALAVRRIKKLAEHPDVSRAAQDTAEGLEYAFDSLDRYIVEVDGVDWVVTRETLEDIGKEIWRFLAELEGAVMSAEKAREEGPELMRKLPDMLAVAERKLTVGVPSPEAVGRLAWAQAQYAEACAYKSETGDTNWPALYPLLKGAQMNVESAETTHVAANRHSSGAEAGSAKSRT